MAKLTNIRIGVDAREAQRGAKAAATALDEVGKSARDAAKELDKLEGEVDDVGQGAKEAEGPVEDLGDATAGAGAAAGGAAGMIGKLVGAISAMVIIHDIVTTITAFETGLTGVGKTTNLAGTALEDLGDAITAMSGQMSTGTAELLEIAQSAGQLGVTGESNILAFTDAVAKLGSASDLAGEDAATALARMLNVTGEATSEVGTLAAVIVELGNNMAITESQIAHVGQQVALSTAVFGTSSTEAAAMGAAMGSMGIRAQLAGSAMGRTMRSIDKAVRQGGEGMQALEQITGKTASEIEETFRDNALSGVVLLLEGLKDLDGAGGDTTMALEALGLQGEEILKVLPSMALRVDDVKTALQLMSEEEQVATAHTEEYERMQDGAAAQSERFSNALDALKLTLKDAVAPALKTVQSTLADVTLSFAGLEMSGRHSETTIKALRAAFVALAIPLSALALEASVAGLAALATTSAVAAAKVWLLNTALMANPFVAVAVAIAAVGSAIWAFTRDTEEAASSVQNLDNKLTALERTANRMAKAEATISLGVSGEDPRRQLAGLRQAVGILEDLQVEMEATEAGGLEQSARQLALMLPRVTQIVEDETGQWSRELLAGISFDQVQKHLDDMLKEGIEVPEGRLLPDGSWEDMTATELESFRAALDANARKFGLEWEAQMANIVRRPAGTEGNIIAGGGKTLAERLYERGIGEIPEGGFGVAPGRDMGIQTGERAVVSGDALSEAAQTEVLFRVLEDLRAQAAALREETDIPKFNPVDNEAIERLERAREALGKYKTALQAAEDQLGMADDAKKILNETTRMEALVDAAAVEGADELKVALEEQIKAISDRNAELKADAETQKALGSHGEMIRLLAAENDLRLEGAEDMAIESQLLRHHNKLKKAGVESVELYVAAMREELELKKQLAEAERKRLADEAKAKQAADQATQQREAATMRAAQLLENTINEMGALSLTNKERERAGMLMEYALTLHAAEAEGIQGKVEQYEALIIALQEAQVWQQMADEMSQAFGDAFNDVILGAATMEEGLQRMAESIGRTVLDTLVTQPLMDWLSGQLAEILPKIFGDAAIETTGAQASAAILEKASVSVASKITGGATAAGAILVQQAQAAAAILAGTSVATAGAAAPGLAKGGVVSGGKLVPMASGSVVYGTTYFPMADGKTGVMGEAGPEAVMPLTRTSDGALGVKVDGAAGGTTNITNVTMTVQATDADSFRKSRYQIARDLRRM